MVLVALYDLELEQMDVVTAFLNGKTSGSIYIELPDGYNNNNKGQVGLLQKGLYGLKQSPHLWQETLGTELQKLGFHPMVADNSIFITDQGVKGIILATYVDDFLIAGPDAKEINIFKGRLSRIFAMKDLGPCKTFLNIEVIRDRKARRIHLTQEHYAKKLLCAQGLEKAKPVSTPMDISALPEMVPYTGQASQDEIKHYQSDTGSLMYLATQTRPDLCQTVSVLSRFNSNPSPAHRNALQRAIRYYGTTAKLGITYSAPGNSMPSELGFHGYSDSDYAGDVETRRSTSGYIFYMGGGPISWNSRRQNAVTLSSTEAEYYALTEASKEAIWLQSFLDELGYAGSDLHPILLHGDNTGALDLAENPAHHARMKHIQVRAHFIREQVKNSTITLKYVPTAEMKADGFTKPLPGPKHQSFLKQLGMVS